MKIKELLEAKTQKAEAPKPRNFVAKNAVMGGAGAHKDKKKAQKQGDAKHKKKNLDMAESKLDEKAVSKAQQRFMGMVHAAQKGETPASKEVAKVAKGMSKKAGHDYASTKHKGLPNHVKEAATAGSTSAANVGVGAVYPNKKGKTFKNKDGTVKNALDVKGANLMTGGSLKR